MIEWGGGGRFLFNSLTQHTHTHKTNKKQVFHPLTQVRARGCTLMDVAAEIADLVMARHAVSRRWEHLSVEHVLSCWDEP